MHSIIDTRRNKKYVYVRSLIGGAGNAGVENAVENAAVDSRAENAEVENGGVRTYGRPSVQKTLRYQECMLKRSGLKLSLNDAHEQRPGVLGMSVLCEYAITAYLARCRIFRIF